MKEKKKIKKKKLATIIDWLIYLNIYPSLPMKIRIFITGRWRKKLK
jgi:hypothetical protein